MQHLYGLDIRYSCGPKLWSRATDFVFACDVIIGQSLEVLVFALMALHEETKHLWLMIFWATTKVQVFLRLLNETLQYVDAFGKHIKILEDFTYLGSVVQNSCGSP